jgi:hypothetical protein
MTLSPRLSSALFIAALAVVSIEARAAFITNGSFDANAVSGNFAVVTPGSAFQISGWNVVTSGNNTSASVDLVRAPYWQAHSGANSIDLFGTGTQQPSFLAQTFSVGIGQTGAYRVSFFYSVNSDGTQDQGLFANVVQGTGVGGTSVATSSTSFFYDVPTDGNPTKQNMAWKQGFLDVNFASSGDYTLWFRGNTQFGNANQGAALDSVSMQAAVVPLPAAAWLMLAGLGVLAAGARRKQLSA